MDPWRDILMVELAEIGYDTFEESTGGLNAYIDSEKFDGAGLAKLLTLRDPHVTVNWTSLEIADRNWNAEWEGSFQPVEVDNDVRIRADFHEPVPGFTHELVITPQMAFGTGHHATTRMMVRAMLKLDLKNKTVCDLGCGTGVLAILAERMGASEVIGIDIDMQAVTNASDNVKRNDCVRISVEKGDTGSLSGRSFDVILANIERNTLHAAMPLMFDALRPNGVLLLSGFVSADQEMLAQRALETGFMLEERMNEGDWTLLGCTKP
ncbi:MAG: 50S ribosomal protein L11 methyltransferase [Bacteroidota bacterium]|nr:50S ribosomal protein L11 methyltransferase [Bacteroidota bacterium]